MDQIETAAKNIVRYVDDRPFVGGIDSAHTILYFGRFGPQLVSSDINRSNSQKLISSAYHSSPFKEIETFTTISDFEQFNKEFRLTGRAPNSKDLLEWMQQYPEDRDVATDHEMVLLEIFPSGETLKAEEVIGNPTYLELRDRVLQAHGLRSRV